MPGSDPVPGSRRVTGLDRTPDEFADDVGDNGPVCVVGAGTRGGGPRGDERVVRAPSGVVRVDAAEMVVECGAGTPVAELQAALAEVGQTVSLPGGGTVGGALAVGRSDLDRLAHGPLRDALLRTRFVSAAGQVVTAGGATVKNVSGFDLCRLLVGSHGTLGFLADVLLRTRPMASASAWYRTDGDPFELARRLYRPVSLLWNGATTWVRLDGDAADLAVDADRFHLTSVEGPPELPGPYRWSLPPAEVARLGTDHPADSFVAEVGVGIVHHTVAPPPRSVAEPIRALHERLRAEFDPTGRLNPGVDVLRP